MREAYLNIIEPCSREVVTVVELLSPANKRRSGPDRSRYLAQRAGELASGANLVEIDLLRGGVPMPDEGRPDCAYSGLLRGRRHSETRSIFLLPLWEKVPRRGG